jgi:hypothetical protein
LGNYFTRQFFTALYFEGAHAEKLKVEC